jgi:hypothetical protein
MTDTELYFAGWVELDRIAKSDIDEKDKDAAIDEVIKRHNMDALWPNVDTDQLDEMVNNYDNQ